MKAKLIFDLDNPDDVTQHLRAIKSLDLAIVIYDILQLRKKIERRFENTDNTNNDVFDGIQEYADEVVKILEERNINIEELLD
jgi:glutamyl-tRNA reductase